MTLKQWIFARKVGEKLKKTFDQETDAGGLIYPQIPCPISCEQIQACMSKFSVPWVVSESRVPAVANISGLYVLIGGRLRADQVSKKIINPSSQNLWVFAVMPWASQLSKEHPGDCHRHQISTRLLIMCLMKYILQHLHTRIGIMPCIEAEESNRANQPHRSITPKRYVAILLQNA